MIKKNRGYQKLKTAATSFFIVILIFVLINGLSTALLKMENTMSPIPYKVFYVEDKKSGMLSVTLLNNKFILDFNRFIDFGTQNQEYKIFVPSTIRIITYSLKMASNAVNKVVLSLF